MKRQYIELQSKGFNSVFHTIDMSMRNMSIETSTRASGHNPMSLPEIMPSSIY